MECRNCQFFSDNRSLPGTFSLSGTQAEFAPVFSWSPYGGDLPQTDLAIPYNEIETNLSQLPAGKDALLVIYCRSGNMSTQAAKTLVDLGYTNVMEVDGGMIAWENSGRPLQDK